MKTKLGLNKIIIGKVLILSILIVGCEDKVKYLTINSEEKQIAEYITSHEEYSEFDLMVRESKIRGLLSSHGPLTMLLPTNDAVFAYYEEKGVNSYLDFDSVTLDHIVLEYFETNDIGYGALPAVNALKDYIVTDFDLTDIILNRRAKIIKRDIKNQNGITHIIDKVLDPLEKTVFQVLEEDPGYSMFSKGLEITKLKDTLNIVKMPYGKKELRNRFTILAVHDTIYQNRGIHSIEELVDTFSTENNTDVTDVNNGFHQYMKYHCLTGVHFLSDFGNRLQNFEDLSAENFVGIMATDDYIINRKGGNYTSFFQEDANIPAKNGVIHPIDDLLPVDEATPIEIEWEVTDHFDIMQQDYYLKYFIRFTDGQNQFENVKWDGDYLLYYYKPEWGPPSRGDCFTMNGFFWIEITTPKIPKGDYLVSVKTHNSNEAPNMVAYLDGERCDSLVLARENPTFGMEYFPIKTVHWKETKQHKIKLVTMVGGLMFLDIFKFTPLDEL